MFSTLALDEIGTPDLLLPQSDQEYFWRNVRLSFFSPYFHVLMHPREWKDDVAGFTVMISDVNHLQLAKHQELSVIDEVKIVTPGDINQTGSWQMDDLVRVEAGYELHDGQKIRYALVYTTGNGQRMLHSTDATSEDELGELRTIFEMPDAP